MFIQINENKTENISNKDISFIFKLLNKMY